eukprot:gnl/TRDRNA2_/TRDRNA2_190758_c0_seq1.p1 gnl/TRDRNA2_/TRDRNA2_190758_c0~~gnl/TRDRNA2_/TRDRNA2_190758_c0_seq1.p1  ORF type:complete len:170 (-),score=21.97 gnl/TRDRNA2_/TRDRNA2_190758_c0_seq1:23-532(-)
MSRCLRRRPLPAAVRDRRFPDRGLLVECAEKYLDDCGLGVHVALSVQAAVFQWADSLRDDWLFLLEMEEASEEERLHICCEEVALYLNRRLGAMFRQACAHGAPMQHGLGLLLDDEDEDEPHEDELSRFLRWHCAGPGKGSFAAWPPTKADLTLQDAALLSWPALGEMY